MTAPDNPIPAATSVPNGAGAAAILAAGIGSVLLAVFAILGDKSSAFKHLFNIYKPTGPLSGVTTAAIIAWLLAWGLLHIRWRSRNVGLVRVNATAFVLLCLGLLLTFPPITDLF
jgi:hypothetical protein